MGCGLMIVLPFPQHSAILKQKMKEVITMPRTKGSKNRPKTNTTKDYASQIAEKQESIASLTSEITSITATLTL